MGKITSRIASIVNDAVFEAERDYDAAYDCCSDEVQTTCFAELSKAERITITLQSMGTKEILKCLELYYQNQHMKFSDYINPHIKQALMKGLFLDDGAIIATQFGYIAQDFEDDMTEIIGKVFSNVISNDNVVYYPVTGYWDELSEGNIINSECPRCGGVLDFDGPVKDPIISCNQCQQSTGTGQDY